MALGWVRCDLPATDGVGGAILAANGLRLDREFDRDLDSQLVLLNPSKAEGVGLHSKI